MEKPILFNTEMVRAILDGRKTVTRRVIDPQPYPDFAYDCAEGLELPNDVFMFSYIDAVTDETTYKRCTYRKSKYVKDDTLWVRETFDDIPVSDRAQSSQSGRYYYKADGDLRPNGWRSNWRPSVHMPREAARIFLRVTDVWVERLQAIAAEEIVKEGLHREPLDEIGEDFFRGMYHDLWDSTIKPRDLPLYGWYANPWVWVIELERLEDYKPNESNP